MEQSAFDFGVGSVAANDAIYRIRIHHLRNRSQYRTAEWLRTRALAMERAHYKCERCGKRSGFLEAHHVEPVVNYPELFYVLSNITVLCQPCHWSETARQALKYGWRYSFK